MVCLVPEEFLERWELTDGLETQVLKTLQGLSFCPCEIGRNREGATREERWVLVRRDQRVDLRRQKTRSNLTWWCHSELRLVDGTKLRPLSRRERCDEDGLCVAEVGPRVAVHLEVLETSGWKETDIGVPDHQDLPMNRQKRTRTS
ncbi:uncharacterized protein LOC133545246 isoform X2 [Nerophis ophidion]|uniref:uncharacterized protein LOC133545246 isoform X2 n=1 Tax=Nerophis ophidion TaxID=159077 RepID=UPI002AE0298E|nr:uncharacterized protein LOC133545246 isoform X2 [Nerophis ophidion]